MNLRQFIWHSRFISDPKRIQWYPVFWLMRIKVIELSPDWRKIRIRLPQTWVSTNMGGSLFGGFQACLADPIAAMACAKLFPDYTVWTRSLTLDFLEQGTSDLELRFFLDPKQERTIVKELTEKNRSTPSFEYAFYKSNGKLCTTIKASIAIRPKGYKKPQRHEISV